MQYGILTAIRPTDDAVPVVMRGRIPLFIDHSTSFTNGLPITWKAEFDELIAARLLTHNVSGEYDLTELGRAVMLLAYI